MWRATRWCLLGCRINQRACRGAAARYLLMPPFRSKPSLVHTPAERASQCRIHGTTSVSRGPLRGHQHRVFGADVDHHRRRQTVILASRCGRHPSRGRGGTSPSQGVEASIPNQALAPAGSGTGRDGRSGGCSRHPTLPAGARARLRRGGRRGRPSSRHGCDDALREPRCAMTAAANPSTGMPRYIVATFLARASR